MEDQAKELRELMSDSIGAKAGNHKTRIMAVTSGKGGVGKSNIAVNLAIAYSQLGKKVILIDGDLGMANVNVLMGIVPQYNLMHVINHKKTMKDIILNTEYGISFIAGANGFSKIANLTHEELDYFAREFSSIANADIIIIDTGAGINNNVLQFVAAADEVYVVTTPEPTAVTDAYGIIKIIATEFVNQPPKIRLLVNRVHTADEGKRISDLIITISAQFLSYKVEYIGFIYDDQAVQASVIRQKPFLCANPASRSAVCIKHIVGRIENTELPSDAGVSNFLKKFLNGKKK